MDHRYRGLKAGLIKLDDIPMRRSRDECKIIKDVYAEEAIRRIVPPSLQLELEGWARSYYTLEKHVEAILSYDSPKLPEPTDEVWNTTKQYVERIFRQITPVTAKSYNELDTVKWVRSSAAGYGYIGRKDENDNYKIARKTAYTIAETLNHDRTYGPLAIENSTPDVAFTRTQLSQLKVKNKVRNVWGEAFHYVLLEGLFADPIIEMFKRVKSFYYLGYNPLFGVPALVEEILTQNDFVYMFDWTQFDSTVQEWEIRFAFHCLSIILRFPSAVEAELWNFIIELFIYRKIASPNGVLFLKSQGVPSGSCFTNIIGSIANFVRIQYMFRSLTGRFVTAFTHGDDSLVGVPSAQFVPMNKFEDVCQPLGWKINIDKSNVSSESGSISFLSRSVRERQNTREELVCLRMLLYPEYEIPSGDVSTLRAKSIYFDAGLHSKYLFRIFEFLNFKYGIAESLPSNLKVWDPLEFETRRLSISETL